MIKNLFFTTISLIFKSSDAWKKLREKRTDDHEAFLSGYLYPFLGVVTLVSFLCALYTHDLQTALKEAIVAIVSLFGGFFLASFLINEAWRAIFHREPDMKLCQRFTGYSSSLMYCLNMILFLLPEFFFLRFIVLYTIYIVWEGAIHYMETDESERLKFVGIATLLILAMPIVLTFILGLMIPGLKF